MTNQISLIPNLRSKSINSDLSKSSPSPSAHVQSVYYETKLFGKMTQKSDQYKDAYQHIFNPQELSQKFKTDGLGKIKLLLTPNSNQLELEKNPQECAVSEHLHIEHIYIQVVRSRLISKNNAVFVLGKTKSNFYFITDQTEGQCSYMSKIMYEKGENKSIDVALETLNLSGKDNHTFLSSYFWKEISELMHKNKYYTEGHEAKNIYERALSSFPTMILSKNLNSLFNYFCAYHDLDREVAYKMHLKSMLEMKISKESESKKLKCKI